MKTLFRLLVLLTLAGCGNADLHQATLCEEVAKLLFADDTIDNLTNATDASAAHGVITTAAMRQPGVSHRVACTFESSGPKSEDQMALSAVTSDVEGRLRTSA